MKPTPIPKRVSAFFLCFALLVGLLPTSALAAEPISHDISQSTLTISQNGDYTVTGTTSSNRIIVSSGVTATITLAGVSITAPDEQPAIDVQDTAKLTIILQNDTTNTLAGGASVVNPGAPCIHVPSNATLTIQGDGELNVTGGYSKTCNAGVGIGGNSAEGFSGAEACGTVIILGGTVNITGGSTDYGAHSGVGIGGGSQSVGTGGAGGTVIILGENVTVKGGNDAKDIGAGGGYLGTSASDGAGIRPSSDRTYTVYGNLTWPTGVDIPNNITINIPSGASLTLPDGATLPEGVTLSGEGNISPDTAKLPASITNISVSKTTYDGNAVQDNQVSYNYTGATTIPIITITWHSASTATDDNKIEAPSAPGTYYVKVSAAATNLYAAAEATQQFTIGAIQLSAPTGLTWEGTTAKWTQVANATGYTVQLYKDNEAHGQAAAIDSGDTISYDFASDMTEAGAYTFTVTATSTSANYSDSTASTVDTALNFYTVTFNTGGGGSTVDSQVVRHGQTATQPNPPTKPGHTFAEWQKDNSIFDFNTEITGDTILTATWTANHYNVTLHLNGGTYPGSTGETYSTNYTYGYGMTLPTESDITRTGYTFGGWYTDSGLSDGPVTSISADETEAKEFWAKWALEEPTVNVTSSATSAVTYGTTVTLTANASHEANVGGQTSVVSFSYQWYKAATGDGSPTEAGTSSTLTLSNVADSGSYYVVVTASDGSQQKTAQSSASTVTINRRAITVTPDSNQSKVYNDADPTLTYQITSGSLVASDTLTGALTRAEGENVGNYNITQGDLTDANNPNYTINFTENVTFAITKANQDALTITGQKGTVTYGDSSFDLNTDGGSSSGAVTWAVTNGNAVSVGENTGEVTVTGVGQVTITATKAGGQNYEDASGTWTFNVQKKSVTAQLAVTAKPYDGDTAATVTATIGNSDLVSGDSITITGLTGTFDDANVGAIKDVTVNTAGAQINGTNSGCYDVTIPTTATGEITAKELTGTVTIGGTAKYGQQLTASYSGEASNETLTYTWYRSGTTDSIATGLTYVLEEADVGKTITVTVTGIGNYSGSKTSDPTATVGKADSSITISCPSVVYGTTPTPEVTAQTGRGQVTYSYSGTGTTDYGPSSEAPTEVGTYTVTATAAETATHTQASAAVEFSITQSGSTLSVSGPGSVAYGGDLTITVAVQDGDGAPITTATGTVTLKIGDVTLATADTPTNGVYTLTCKAGRDLAIGSNALAVTYTGDSNVGGSNGAASVTLTPKAVSASVNGTPSKTYDAGTDITVALAVDGLENGDTLTGTVSGSFANADAGTDKAITLGNNPTWSDADAAGYYTIALPTGVTGTITKATPTLNLTAAPTALTGGGRVTLTLTGLPDGESATVICGESSIAVTNNNDGTWTTGNLPNQTKDYTFTATFAGSGNYEAATASCQVSVTRRSSGGSTTPSRPSTTEPSTGSSGGWDEIGTEIAEAQPGETIVVDMNGATEVPAEIFEEVAGKDVTVEFDLGGGISWTVNGQDVPTGTSFQSLNLGVDMGTSGISVNVINNITGEYGTVQMTLAHDGEFGFTLTLTAPLGSDNAGHWANLYYYHEDNETLTFQTSGRIGADGSVSLRFSHASQYAIVIDDYDHGAEELPFTDVAESAWYYDAVSYVYTEGLMAGTSGTTFSPDITTSRAMIAVILWRLEGSPATSEYTDFSDVADGVWYAEGVRWASSVGVVGGYPNGSFGPNDPITREQMAAMLYRYADYKGCDVTDLADLSAFTDAEDISGYAVTALRWANAAGIVGGYNDSTLRPQGEARRSEAAAMLQRFCENKAK